MFSVSQYRDCYYKWSCYLTLDQGLTKNLALLGKPVLSFALCIKIIVVISTEFIMLFIIPKEKLVSVV